MLAMNVPYLRRSAIMILTAPLTATHVSPTLHFAQYTKVGRVKKLKPSGNETTASPPSSLTPEQLAQIGKNKQAALEKLCASNAPDEFGESWRKGLGSEFGKPYFRNLMSFVDGERKRNTVYPPPQHVFTWTQMCDIQDVKVVVLGQDPYHGVLLLNAVLTVRAHQANSHKDKGWETFTDTVVQWLSTNLEGLVFMLWGAYAQKKGAAIDRKRHHVLHTVHPSPLSAHRGFFGCKHFSKTNELLEKSGKEPIDWKAL
ncbi:unnamed protein product [Coregonus sp. 'balchen']|nr:unnamed protein product [Coregonus sp. 'balchen']